jgi:hypothetical protein
MQYGVLGKLIVPQETSKFSSFDLTGNLADVLARSYYQPLIEAFHTPTVLTIYENFNFILPPFLFFCLFCNG